MIPFIKIFSLLNHDLSLFLQNSLDLSYCLHQFKLSHKCSENQLLETEDNFNITCSARCVLIR